jgi:hypothetical protein
MALKRRLQRLQKTARGRLAWLDLPDGSSFYFNRERTGLALFLYAAQTLQALRAGEPPPEPPEVLRAVAALPTREDREKAFWQVYGPGSKPFVSFDLERFYDEGVLVPHPGLKRKQPEESGDGAVDDDNLVLGKPPKD